MIETVRSSISSEKSAEIAMLLQMAEDCSRRTIQKHYALCLVPTIGGIGIKSFWLFETLDTCEDNLDKVTSYWNTKFNHDIIK